MLEAQGDAANPQSLPAQWNRDSTYSFRYAHTQSSMEYLVKVQRMGGKAVVLGMALGDDRTTSFDVPVKDYISDSSLPLAISADASEDDAKKKLQDVFISTGRLGDFASLFKLKVIQKLAPGLQKEGYEDSRAEHNRAEGPERDQQPRGEGREPRRPPNNEPEPARPSPFDDPLRLPPRNPNRPLPEPIPGFEDEYEINAPPYGLRDDRFPAGIGHNDLYPPDLGPHDPLRPHLGGGIPRPGGFGGGMHPTFDDPLFAGQGQGGGNDPMNPPGARYDPVGPSDLRRDNRGGGQRFPGGGGGGLGGLGGLGGRPPNPFGRFGDGDFI